MLSNSWPIELHPTGATSGYRGNGRVLTCLDCPIALGNLYTTRHM